MNITQEDLEFYRQRCVERIMLEISLTQCEACNATGCLFQGTDVISEASCVSCKGKGWVRFDD